ncbi:uncharacterized protein LOC134776330 [Penaeus indicus]|uniref:uncharacterized protein LOC134776330 n=1 Tax=Penaeus indicus TaxID=29960 RepID=UPI00300C35FA
MELAFLHIKELTRPYVGKLLSDWAKSVFEAKGRNESSDNNTCLVTKKERDYEALADEHVKKTPINWADFLTPYDYILNTAAPSRDAWPWSNYIENGEARVNCGPTAWLLWLAAAVVSRAAER